MVAQPGRIHRTLSMRINHAIPPHLSLDVTLLNHGLPRKASLLTIGQADDVALLHLHLGGRGRHQRHGGWQDRLANDQ